MTRTTGTLFALCAAAALLASATTASATQWRCWANGTPKPHDYNPPTGTAAGSTKASAQRAAVAACRAKGFKHCKVTLCHSF